MNNGGLPPAVDSKRVERKTQGMRLRYATSSQALAHPRDRAWNS